MNRFRPLLSVAFVGAMAAAAAAQQPFNDKCPVKGTNAKASITTEYQGKKIAFC